MERDTQMYLKRERDRNRERKNIKDNKIKMKKQKERRGLSVPFFSSFKTTSFLERMKMNM